MDNSNKKMKISVKGTYDSNVKFTAAVKYQRFHGGKASETNEMLYADIYSIVNSYRSKVSKHQQSNENYEQVMLQFNESLQMDNEEELLLSLQNLKILCLRSDVFTKYERKEQKLIKELKELDAETLGYIIKEVTNS